MMTFDCTGPLLVDFLERGATINAKRYAITLQKLRRAIKSKRLKVAENVEVTRGKIWTVQRMLQCFPAKSLKLIPHQIGSMGKGVILQKDDSVRQHYRAF